MVKVMLSAGPIPAKLDSVKIVTNKFKGGLAVKTAEMLADYADLAVELVKWKGADLHFAQPTAASRIKVHEVEDILAYRDLILNTAADVYILAAAVANLMPVHPWPGKFPSHQYHVGEEFDIKFTIAPRIIDDVKQRHPRSTLIGYKLFDGAESALIDAGWETLCHSRANVIFCNHPATAKQEKIALLPDGTYRRLSFAEHVAFMHRVIHLQWYATAVQPVPYQNPWENAMAACLATIGVERAPYRFGTVAVRDGAGFLTTTRGKRGEKQYCRVLGVDHEQRRVTASAKATLNAPMLERLFHMHPDANWILHGHRQIADAPTYPYSFSGTIEETTLAASLPVTARVFNVAEHGYYALFPNWQQAEEWMYEQYKNGAAG